MSYCLLLLTFIFYLKTLLGVHKTLPIRGYDWMKSTAVDINGEANYDPDQKLREFASKDEPNKEQNDAK